MNLPQHGSNPQYVYKKMGISRPTDVIDFSANINPLGPPEILKQKWCDFYDQIYDYPDPFCQGLITQIAKQTDTDADTILIGNGGAEIITLIGRMLAGKNIIIMEPAFSEYEKVCAKNGCNIFYHYLKEPDWELNVKEIDLHGIDAVFLCNPNNPTGVQYPYTTILELLEACKRTNAYLIMDEAFFDFLEDYQPTPPLLKSYPKLIILRSMTKMFAIPGLRLGYALASKEIMDKLSDYQAHWSVNTLAMLAGEVCLQDDRFVELTIHYIRTERRKLFSFFHDEGFLVSPSKVNFYLLRDKAEEESLSLFAFLLKRGIVARHTYNFPGLEGKWLRFAIKGKQENDQLMEVLKTWRRVP